MYINQKIKYSLILIIPIFLMPEKAFAYLDPGTGSMIAQVMIAAFGSIGYGAVLFRKKIKEFTKRFINKLKK